MGLFSALTKTVAASALLVVAPVIDVVAGVQGENTDKLTETALQGLADGLSEVHEELF